MCMADHFGGGSDMQIDFVEVLDFFDASESDAICFVLGDDFLDELFLHDTTFEINIKQYFLQAKNHNLRVM